MAPANRAPRKDDIRGLREEPSVVPSRAHKNMAASNVAKFFGYLVVLWLIVIVGMGISGLGIALGLEAFDAMGDLVR